MSAGDDKTILVVEDHEAAAEALAILLDGAGYRTTIASTGAEAIRCVRESPPDLVLLDLGLPDMHGLDVLRTMRERTPSNQVQVVALTGDATEHEACLNAGCDGFLVKPVRGQELLDVVTRTLS